MKLIIDIPEDIYKTSKEIEAKYEGSVNIPLELIANGTPLDDIKTEIEKETWDTQEIDGEHENRKVVDLSDVLQILDNIGEAESEG